MSTVLFTDEYYWYPQSPVWRVTITSGAFTWIECYTRADSESCYGDCFEVIAEHAPNAFVPFGKEREHDPDFDPGVGMVDHTCTEHGWLASWEWGVHPVASDDTRHLEHALQHLEMLTEDDEITCALRNLSTIVRDFPEDKSYAMHDAHEFGLVTLWSALEAGYWLMSHYCEGMHSDAYEALSAIGGVFTPGCGSERDTCIVPETDEDGNVESRSALLYAKWSAIFEGG